MAVDLDESDQAQHMYPSLPVKRVYVICKYVVGPAKFTQAFQSSKNPDRRRKTENDFRREAPRAPVKTSAKKRP
jgi:hypothetical protein